LHVLSEVPCPYLPGKRERKLLTELRGPGAKDLYVALSRAGFRRSHHLAYRPACSDCAACVPIRIAAGEFRPRRSQKRVLRENRDLTIREAPVAASEEQFRLFEQYIQSRHNDGEMAAMAFDDFAAMVEDSPLDTRLAEFRTADGSLAAAMLSDWLDDGPSAVYSFFDPAAGPRSLGTLVILWLIEQARQRGLPYVYLGYWIAGARKMAYKANFQPAEGLIAGRWQPLLG